MITYAYAKPQFTTMSEGSGWFDSGPASGSAALGMGASQTVQTSFVTSPETITYAGSGLVFVNTYGAGVSATFRTEIHRSRELFPEPFHQCMYDQLQFRLATASCGLQRPEQFQSDNGIVFVDVHPRQ
jgi:hypothetical protein